MASLVQLRKRCRLCDSSRIVMSVPLARVPIVSPNVGAETAPDGESITTVVAPLDNYLCLDCGLNQLVHVVDPALIYRDYLYRTSVSLGLPDHFRGLAEAVIERGKLRPGDLVCEFGSNDGTLLNYFRQRGMAVQGVDPARQIAAEATARGVPTLPEFFTHDLAQRLARDVAAARALIANNAMANIDDLAEILSGVKALLADDGVFVFETQYALDVFEKFLLDVIYHEHISTFSVQPVVKAFPRHGLEVFDVERIPTKGGSIRFWVQHANGPRSVAPAVRELVELECQTGLYDLEYHRQFGDRVAAIRAELHEAIDLVRAKGGTVAAYGTSVGCAALIHQFSLEERLDMLFDDHPFKDWLEGPGYRLPVKKTADVYQALPDLIVILAWRYAQPIMAKHASYLDKGGRFIVPLPQPSLVAGRSQ